MYRFTLILFGTSEFLFIHLKKSSDYFTRGTVRVCILLVKILLYNFFLGVVVFSNYIFLSFIFV